MKTPSDKIISVGLVFELGWMVALPLVGLTIMGVALDSQMHTSPVFLLIGMFAASVLSTLIVWRKISRLTDE